MRIRRIATGPIIELGQRHRTPVAARERQAVNGRDLRYRLAEDEFTEFRDDPATVGAVR